MNGVLSITDDKITDSTKKVMNERNQLRLKKQRDVKGQIKLTELNKNVRKKMREDLKQWEDRKIQEIIEKYGSTRRMRKELCEGHQLITRLGNRKSREGINEEATKFYRELYKEENIGESRVRYGCNNEEYIPKFVEDEIDQVLKDLKVGKAPGPDKVDPTNLKALNQALTPALTEFYNAILEFETTPSQWELAEIRILHKKGEKSLISNYRPISLTSNINKLFMKLSKNRIYNTLDANQGLEQAGFRKKFSTVDHIFTVDQLIEKANEYNIEVFLIFVDFTKAFDSVKHSQLRQALSNQGIPKKWVEIFREMYEKAKAYT